MWKIEKIINFGKSGQFIDGFARFGFHVQDNFYFVLAHDFNWLGLVKAPDRFYWTAGEKPEFETDYHFNVAINRPSFIAKVDNHSFLVTTANGVIRLDSKEKSVEMIIDAKKEGIDFVGNALLDDNGSIWINDIFGFRLLKYDVAGNLLEVIGNGKPGFAKADISFEKASFEWVFDIRKGPDGNIYVLDSRNFSLRMLDIENRLVKLIAGTGEPGYSGDGGDPLKATFGGNSDEEFDGPWALVLDEKGNIYVGDTQNHLVRMIDKEKKVIQTIAGNSSMTPDRKNNSSQKDPFKLNLPRICSLDYCNNKLYIPDWDGDLIILKKTEK